MPRKPVILGIETSCDDTAAAILSNGRLISSVVSAQIEHAAFGGVVPEMASRAHQRMILPVVQRALDQAGVDRDDLDAIAVTYGPGLAGSLHVGVGFAKALAFGLSIPLIGVNHLEGHLYSLFLGDSQPSLPMLCLIASGGHTQLMQVEASLKSTILGKTRDDAAGEAFDKVAQLLGLPYPGGPEIEIHARNGNRQYISFPRTSLPEYDYSFSGIKTSVLYYLNSFTETERTLHLSLHLDDICASFQEAMVQMMIHPILRAVHQTGILNLAIVGGVSANMELQQRVRTAALASGGHFIVPDSAFSMDNAAMIAAAGHHRFLSRTFSPLSLTVAPALQIS